MSRLKQSIGISYEVLSVEENQVLIRYQYLCPYCHERPSVIKSSTPSAYEVVKGGGFSDQLTCCICEKTATVVFFGSMEIG